MSHIGCSVIKYLNCCKTAHTYLFMMNHNVTYDHFAIRSLNKKYYSSDTFLNKFNLYNYSKMNDKYLFPKYSTKAIWYKSLDDKNNLFNIPRIFASYHKLEHDQNLTNEIKEKISNKKILTFDEYLDIYEKNQYVAWTYLFNDDINHIAIEVDNINETTENLIKQRIKFNSDGGIYKVSDDKLLIQTSTMADMIEYKFADKVEYVPHAFVEFVQRLIDPTTEKKRDGFETQNADKIFASTANMASVMAM